MSKLNRLIQELCPNGVEYRKLGEVISIYTGTQFNKRDMSDVGTFPVINGGINPSGYIETYNEEACTISISQGGASAGYVAWQSSKFWAGAHCYVVKPKNEDLSNKYLYFFLKSNEEYLRQMQHGAGIPALNRKKVQDLFLPLPPLPIQEEIVKILDRFAEYTAELQAELQARKEQYEYYRNLLLTNNFAYGSADDKQKITGNARGEWKWMTLGEVGTFTRGNGLQKKDFTESGVPCIHYGQIYTYYGTSTEKTKSFCSPDLARKLRKAKYGDLVIATTSENVDDVCKSVVYLGKEEACVSSDAFIYSHNQNPKYIGYFFQTYFFQKQKLPYITGTKVMRISDKALSKIQIPIPPLAEQERIVSILDKFEALVSDLTQGLPAEIAASQERYEYYRDKLLRF